MLKWPWIGVFKSGTHTSSNGTTKTYTDEDLEKIAEQYNVQEEHDAPLVLGHPETNGPAHGWIGEMKKVGQYLYAKVVQAKDDVEQWIKDGHYRKVSISLYDDLTLRHVGLLGGTPPAVKGLPAIQFKEDAAYSEHTCAFLPDTQKEEPTQEEQMDKEKITALEKEKQEFADKLTAAEAEVAALRKKAKEEEVKAKRAQFNAFCDNLMREGKLLPAQKGKAVCIMEVLAEKGEHEFSDDDGTTYKKQILKEFQDMLKDLPKSFDFEEQATTGKAGDKKPGKDEYTDKPVDPDRLDQHQKIKAIAEKDSIPYSEAAMKYFNTVIQEEKHDAGTTYCRSHPHRTGQRIYQRGVYR